MEISAGNIKTTPYSLFTSVLVLVIRDYGLVERLNGQAGVAARQLKG